MRPVPPAWPNFSEPSSRFGHGLGTDCFCPEFRIEYAADHRSGPHCASGGSAAATHLQQYLQQIRNGTPMRKCLVGGILLSLWLAGPSLAEDQINVGTADRKPDQGVDPSPVEVALQHGSPGHAAPAAKEE
jgi:hypothetical protein